MELIRSAAGSPSFEAEFAKLVDLVGREPERRSGWQTALPWGRAKLEALTETDRQASANRTKSIEAITLAMQKHSEYAYKKIEAIQGVLKEKNLGVAEERKLVEDQLKLAMVELKLVEARANVALIECPVKDCGYVCKDNAALKQHHAKFHSGR